LQNNLYLFVAPQQISATMNAVSSIPKKWIYARLVRAFFSPGQPGKNLAPGRAADRE
jgi:hypothetical protein